STLALRGRPVQHQHLELDHPASDHQARTLRVPARKAEPVAVDKKGPGDAVTDFDDWYVGRRENERTGALEFRNLAPCAQETWNRFEEFKREHNTRVANYWKYEVMADAEVVSRKPDLPNVSSGDIAGMVRRTARNVVQHTPNVQIISEFA